MTTMNDFRDLFSAINAISPADIYKAAKIDRTHLEWDILDYEAQCKEYAEAGYRPHYCIHGANLWVDHDIPCGWCEMGDDPRDVTLADLFSQKKAEVVSLRKRVIHVQEMLEWGMRDGCLEDIVAHAARRIYSEMDSSYRRTLYSL